MEQRTVQTRLGVRMPVLLVVQLFFASLLSAQGAPLTFSGRVDAKRAVERVRYGFVIGATEPFDKVYPRSFFERKVRLELDQERVLKTVFDTSITAEMLADEFKRIEVTTQDQEQWDAIKAVLNNHRPLIEEVFCRPLIAERLLRQKFALDRSIHAGPHQKAREARARFQSRKKVPGSRVLLLSRRSSTAFDTREALDKARKESAGPRVLTVDPKPSDNTPRPTEPALARVLEKELKRPGDVTTILEHTDRFDVYRLLSISSARWRVEAVSFPKLDFDQWFDQIRPRA